jgi:hypothetical protein
MSQLQSNGGFAEWTMQNFWEFADSPGMSRYLSVVESLGYAASMVEFVLDRDNYYFPEVRNGNELFKPESVREDRIPVVAIEPGQELLLPGPNKLHPLQVASMQDLGCDDELIDIIEADFRGSVSLFSVDNECDDLAMVMSETKRVRNIENGNVSAVLSSPVLIFIDKPGIRQEGLCHEAGAHEITHLIQYLSNFKLLGKTLLDCELEGHAVQADIHDMHVVCNTFESGSFAIKLNNLRKKMLGKDVFRSTNKFTNVLAKDPAMRKLLV